MIKATTSKDSLISLRQEKSSICFFLKLKKYLSQFEHVLNAQAEAWKIFEKFLGKTRSEILSLQSVEFSKDEFDFLKSLLKRRTILKEPLDYILGVTDFIDLKIKVEKPILIPRVETAFWLENLCDKIEEKVSKDENFSVLDIGTGSGCIALYLAKRFKSAEVFGVDIDPRAIRLAEKNRKELSLFNVSFLVSDLFEIFSQHKKFDLIISNPAYISYDERELVQDSVKKWESPKALFAKNDGLEFFEKISKVSKKFLTQKFKNKGLSSLVFEIGAFQKKAVERILRKEKFSKSVCFKDFLKKDRCVWAYL